jgi:putative transposase
MRFKKHPEIIQILNGGKFWTSGYYINTVGLYTNEQIISNYVKKQGKTYQQTHRAQLTMFDGVA